VLDQRLEVRVRSTRPSSIARGEVARPHGPRRSICESSEYCVSSGRRCRRRCRSAASRGASAAQLVVGAAARVAVASLVGIR
jgi:hypothetical protein